MTPPDIDQIQREAVLRAAHAAKLAEEKRKETK